jgi:hypothetical protein
VALIVVELVKVTEVDDVPPNFTLDPAVKPVPVMVTTVPPPTGPIAGATPVTVGAATKVKAAALVPVPPTVVTETATAGPAAWALVTAVKVVLLVKWTDAAAVAPNVTVDAAVKEVPVMVTEVPPVAGPLEGVTVVTVGAVRKVKAVVLVTVPPGVVVTETLTTPATCAGVVALITVALVTVTSMAGFVPNLTVAGVVKPVPVMVTTVPPAALPLTGVTLAIVGAAT